MSETAKTPATTKQSWFKGLKAEWKKILWPSKKTVIRESTAVVIITVILSVLIKALDTGLVALLNIIL